MSNIPSIRPRQLFELLDSGAHNSYASPFPAVRITEGGLTSLETMVIAVLVKLINPAMLFEFGTFLGFTTATLAMNSRKDAVIHTLDLGQDTPSNTDGCSVDQALIARSASEGAVYVDALPADIKSKIRRHWGDSRLFDARSNGLTSSVDFIFIDGGHDYETVSSDTRKAFEMTTSHSVIVWHDYSSALHSGVTECIDGLGVPTFHVGDTMLAVWAPILSSRLHI